MKIKGVIIFALITAVLLCGCAKNEFTLEDTVWKYGNDVIINFYQDGNGTINVAGTELNFTYLLDEGLLTVTCTDTALAEDYGLNTLPFFATNAVTEKDGSLFVGSWELIKTE